MWFLRHFCFKTRVDIALLLITALSVATAANAQVRDGMGQAVTLARPAQRIVTLSPHATELVFAAGAGAQVVGVSDYSDYPPQAVALPKVASAGTVDIERVLALKPDLIVSWASGVSPAAHAQLRKLGIAVFESEPRTLNAIADEVAAIAQLAGTSSTAQPGVAALRAQIVRLRENAAQNARGKPPVRVFHQIWERPLMTVNGQHIMSDAITLCGGVNVFAAVKTLTPTVTFESVVALDPQVISTGSAEVADKRADPLAQWRAMPGLAATKHKGFAVLDSNKFARATPRMLEEVARLCAVIGAAQR
jgi:iron complex transport system substrate-binding protein